MKQHITNKDYDLILDHPSLLDSLELVYHTAFKELQYHLDVCYLTEQKIGYYRAVDVKGVKEFDEYEKLVTNLNKEILEIINHARRLTKTQKGS